MDGFTIDLTPLIDPIVTMLAAIVTVLAGYLVRVVAARLGVERQYADQAVRDYLEPGLATAIEYARARIKAAGPITIETREALVATAAGYAIRHFPDALKHFGINEAALREIIEARLPPLPA